MDKQKEKIFTLLYEFLPGWWKERHQKKKNVLCLQFQNMT